MKAVEELQNIVRNAAHDNRYDNEIMNAFDKSGIKGLFVWLTGISINRPLPAIGLGSQPFFIAWWYAIAGDKENSIYWLEKNMEAKQKMYPYFNLIATNPDFDILRNDPRFKAIIEKLGLTRYNKRKVNNN